MGTIELAIVLFFIALPIGVALALFGHFYDAATREREPVTWQLPPREARQARHSAQFLYGRGDW